MICGLRDYQIEPVVWGGEGCAHEWGEELKSHKGGKQKDEHGGQRVGRDFSAQNKVRDQKNGQFCHLCGAWRGSYGLEPTIELYVEHTVQIFRELRRVLRKDGVLFLNLGDSYATNGHQGGKTGRQDVDVRGWGASNTNRDQKTFKTSGISGLKPKDLCGVPWRVALALQADGWWLRSDIIWSKPNPMPESCTDRPTKSHEYIFMMSKSQRYFWDQEAVREKAVTEGDCRYLRTDNTQTNPSGRNANNSRQRTGNPTTGRNLRTVWEMATAPFPEAHFATFPPSLPERCIKAGTSEKGCCPKCLAPWKRVVEVKQDYKDWAKTQRFYGKGGQGSAFRMAKTNSAVAPQKSFTTGWTTTCKCLVFADQPYFTIPCTVLDPFSGAGTTALVAAKLGRDAIGIELNPEYVEMSRKRLTKELGMLAKVEVGKL